MDENNELILEDTFPGFDDEPDTDGPELDGSQTEATEMETDEAAETEEKAATEESSVAETEKQAPEAEKQAAQEDPDAGLPEKITIKHLKGDYDVPREKIRDTLEKGVDYDRVREQRDTAMRQLEQQTKWRQDHETMISTLETLATKSGTDLEAVVKRLRINLHRGNGATEAEALAKVAQEDAEVKLAMSQRQTQEAHRAQNERQSRAQREFLEFNRRYPNVKVQDVPKDVLQRAASGEMTLANAYADHLYSQLKAENQRLQQSLKAKQQNETNKQKSTGSLKTDGNSTKDDSFLSGFNDY